MTKKYVRRLIYVTLICCLFAQLVQAQYHFGSLTYDKGLSNSTVLSICRDHAGFLWIGTRDGLNRYDGNRIKQYRSDNTDIHTISTNNYIYSIVEHPRQKTLWIGTQQGLNIYQAKQDRFQRINFEHVKPKNSNHFAVLAIYFAESGVLLGTNNGLMRVKNADNPKIEQVNLLEGLEIYALLQLGRDILVGTNRGLYRWRDQKTLESIKLKNTNSLAIVVKDIKRVATDKIWIATDGHGLFELDKLYQQTAHYTSKTGLASDYVRSIAVDKSKNIWVGTMEGGNLLQPNGNPIQQIKTSANNPFSINDNSIKTIYIDRQGIVWMGTNFGGINYHHPSAYPFRVDLADGDFRHLSGNLVSAIAVDDAENTWVGTERDGLNLRKKGSNVYQKIALRSNTIKCLLTDDNYIYVGTFGAGLARISRQNTNYIRYYNITGENGITLLQNYISSITQDKLGNLWIGTGNKGLQMINNEFTQAIQPTSTFTKNTGNNYVKDILASRSGNLLIGTAQGLGQLQDTTGNQGLYRSKDVLKDHYINTLFEDKTSQIWIGTQEKGLYHYNPKTARVTRVELFPKRSYYHVLGIAENNTNEIIVSTNNGLVFYNKSTREKRYMDIQDGFPTNEFLPNAIFCSDGQLLVGSHKGLISLDLSKHLSNAETPKLLISGLSINGQSKTAVDKILRHLNPSHLEEIALNHDQNTFTIDFSSDNLINPQKNSYAYKIDELEKQWNLTDQPSITYTNLSPGRYTLQLKTANNDGLWSKVSKTLVFNIAPPFYKSNWAYMGYTILLMGIVYFIYRYNLDKKQLKTKLYYEEKLHQDQAALMQSKLDFFTKISHEIRTPLTLIHAPIEKILRDERLDHQVNAQLQQVRRNIKRLLHLTQELLSFNKMDGQKLILNKVVLDSTSYFENIHQSFVAIAEEFGVTYVLDNQFRGSFMADPQQLEKVLLNLLSNAFKFRGENAPLVRLVINSCDKDLLIHVMDNGQGIKAEDRERIFDTFYQADAGKGKEGWGIGLSFAKELVELHQGTLYLDNSQPLGQHAGTVFTILLPACMTQQPGIPTEINSAASIDDPVPVRIPDSALDFQLLIVEDNDELRAFLLNHLQACYSVTAAANGKEALEAIADSMPDIIITDIAMPQMDGYTLVKLLKADPDTAHIPVIMLTAKGEEQDSIIGYQSGIINYVTKPFNLQVLDLQIFNTITALELVKERNKRYLLLSKRDEIISNTATAYLDKLRATVEAHIAETDFSVTSLADNMGQSPSALLKKVKSLTGLSVAELIKDIRLTTAANLLIASDQVASVAYAVGFNDRKYFSKEFKKKFGVNPTQYREDCLR
ncbi:two-component regulator propeller domain-containing protein [Sphingobacterium sp.]|uniref:hybrid sensor histidine kinase/response regulator transcription factor n=1 Tax=Sphingobacterium sp. TaxID=341027 RepID=UPI0028A0544B|nr:two-component regulator propeller domain-containing protein [Sphingobacterium sp.]